MCIRDSLRNEKNQDFQKALRTSFIPVVAVESCIRSSIESIWDLKVRKPYLDRVDERSAIQARNEQEETISGRVGPEKTVAIWKW